MSFDPAPSLPLPTPNPPEIVLADTPCRKCSYNLRTLRIESRCPECGTPVAVSIYGDLLRYSDPAWMRKLRVGSTLVLVNIFLFIGLMVLGVALGAMRMFTPHENAAVFRSVSFAASVVGWVGSWLLTERDPSGIGEDQYGNVRRFIRITLLLGVASSFVETVFSFTTLAPAVSASYGVVAGVLGLIGVAGLWALLEYFGKLALRIPDQALFSRAQSVKVWLCSACAIYRVLGIIESLSYATRGIAGVNGGFMIVGCAGVIVGLIIFVQAILFILLIDRFRGVFKEQGALAELIWAVARDKEQ